MGSHRVLQKESRGARLMSLLAACAATACAASANDRIRVIAAVGMPAPGMLEGETFIGLDFRSGSVDSQGRAVFRGVFVGPGRNIDGVGL